MKLARLAVSLVWIALVSPAAFAAPCAGFGDVDTSNPFCADVQWLKNRGVTTGCTVGTYCPDQSLTRLVVHGGPTVNDIAATLVYRMPPNTLWQTWGPVSRTANQSGQPVSQAPTAPPLAMVQGENYAFAIRTAGGTGGTPAVSIGQCSLVVRVDNRN